MELLSFGAIFEVLSSDSDVIGRILIVWSSKQECKVSLGFCFAIWRPWTKCTDSSCNGSHCGSEFARNKWSWLEDPSHWYLTFITFYMDSCGHWYLTFITLYMDSCGIVSKPCRFMLSFIGFEFSMDVGINMVCPWCPGVNGWDYIVIC